MSHLKKFIEANRAAFDEDEPGPNHFEKFNDRLRMLEDKSIVSKPSFQLLKVAAVIVVLISISVLLFEVATSQLKSRLTAEGPGYELPQDISDAIQYYDNESASKIATLRQLALNEGESEALCGSVMSEIKLLDATTTELRKSLEQTPGNQHIYDAIIQNQQMKESMLNNVIDQLKKSKNLK